MKAFYKLKDLNQEPSCRKNYMNTFCINLNIINYPKNSKSTLTTEISLLDFHKLVVTALQVKNKNVFPKITNYREDRKFGST